MRALRGWLLCRTVPIQPLPIFFFSYDRKLCVGVSILRAVRQLVCGDVRRGMLSPTHLQRWHDSRELFLTGPINQRIPFTDPVFYVRTYFPASLLSAAAYAALCGQRDRLILRLKSSPDSGYAGPDVEEDVGQEAAVTARIPLPTALRAPPPSERSSVVNPIFAGSGSRMKRQWPQNVNCEHRTSLASIETEMSSGEDLESGWPVDGEGYTANSGGKHSKGYFTGAPAGDGAGKRADVGTAGGGLTAHPSSWAGYGGAAAWVRSSKDATPPGRGAKGGVRRAPPRF